MFATTPYIVHLLKADYHSVSHRHTCVCVRAYVYVCMLSSLIWLASSPRILHNSVSFIFIFVFFCYKIIIAMKYMHNFDRYMALVLM